MAIVTLLLVSFIVFSLMELVPGTCAERYLAFKNTQGSKITVEDIEAARAHLASNVARMEKIQHIRVSDICDGKDPEGNTIQITAPRGSR